MSNNLLLGTFTTRIHIMYWMGGAKVHATFEHDKHHNFHDLDKTCSQT